MAHLTASQANSLSAAGNGSGRGGAKLIWGEATALFDEVKSNSRQLIINDETAGSMEAILNLTRNAHREEFGANEEVIVGMQLTHSGRYSYQKPLIAFATLLLTKSHSLIRKTRSPSLMITLF